MNVETIVLLNYINYSAFLTRHTNGIGFEDKHMIVFRKG